jgi:SP family galactose:H+ symporter-like MFS transporter
VTSLNQLCITLGILLSYPVGYSFAGTPAGWRWMVGLGAVPGAILAAGMLVLPESPRWLAGHNRMPQAEAVLRHLRATPAEVARELASLRTDLLREGGRLVPWSALLAPRLRPALVIGVGLAMFQQIIVHDHRLRGRARRITRRQSIANLFGNPIPRLLPTAHHTCSFLCVSDLNSLA